MMTNPRRLARRLIALAIAALTFAPMASAGVIPTESEDFFFIHLSDVHVYRHSSQVAEHYGLGPTWLPRTLLAYIALSDYEEALVPYYSDAIVPHMRKALGIAPEDASLFEIFDARDYFNELLRPGSELGDAEAEIRASFAEVHALGPEFIINTGDIVFDSGRVPKAISDDWMKFYREVSESGSAKVYNTIGNHELGLVEWKDPPQDDPLLGPGFFRNHLGPSFYSFDRGGFHFVALDTHSPGVDDEGWRFNKMRPEVASWLEADLRNNADNGTRKVVFLNHEPFFVDPEWLEDEDLRSKHVVDVEGILERHSVAYTMTGHIHLPGLEEDGPTTHIATGALSGTHWILPPEAAPRGYRLAYAHGPELFTAWKATGKPVLGFIQPAGPGKHFPASKGQGAAHALAGQIRIVAVAADVAGPFARVRLQLDGVEIPVVRWGDFFLAAEIPAAAAGRTLTLLAEGSTGVKLKSTVRLPASE